MTPSQVLQEQMQEVEAEITKQHELMAKAQNGAAKLHELNIRDLISRQNTLANALRNISAMESA